MKKLALITLVLFGLGGVYLYTQSSHAEDAHDHAEHKEESHEGHGHDEEEGHDDHDGDTQSITFPSGMPRPKSRMLTRLFLMEMSTFLPWPMMNTSMALSITSLRRI